MLFHHLGTKISSVIISTIVVSAFWSIGLAHAQTITLDPTDGVTTQSSFVIGDGNTTDVNIDLVAKQGVSPDGILRYNAVSNQWEIANDGSNFFAISTSASSGGDLDNAYDNDVDKILNIDNASGLKLNSTVAGNIVVDLQSTGNFIVQDAGTTFANFTSNGEFQIDNIQLDNNTISATNTNGSIILDANGSGNINSLDNIDLNLNQLLQARLENSASDPATCNSSNEGRVYYNTTSKHSFICDGSTWIQLDNSASSGGSSTFDDVLEFGAKKIDGMEDNFLDNAANNHKSDDSAPLALADGEVVAVTLSTEKDAGDNWFLQIIKNATKSGTGIFKGGTQIGTDLEKPSGQLDIIHENLSGFNFSKGDRIAAFIKKGSSGGGKAKEPVVRIFIKYNN